MTRAFSMQFGNQDSESQKAHLVNNIQKFQSEIKQVHRKMQMAIGLINQSNSQDQRLGKMRTDLQELEDQFALQVNAMFWNE
jgi:hypothetical protein